MKSAQISAIDLLPCFPLIYPDFLSAHEHKKMLLFLTEEASSFGALGGTEDYWKGRTLTVADIKNATIRQMLIETRDRAITLLSVALTEHLGSEHKLYSDLVNFARWPMGYELQPHADSENPNGVPHPFPWRHFGSVTYLNDDYAGGEIYFPNLDLELKPNPRTLIIFPGTLKYLHGVRKITSGMRHTTASFMTFDASKHDGYGQIRTPL